MPAFSASELAKQIQAKLFDLPDREPESGKAGTPAARQKGRDAQWRADMAKAYAYNLSRAKTPEDRAAAEAEYERILAKGADFTRYRRKSEFRNPPQNRIDRNAIARMRFQLATIRRGSWSAKRKGKHAGAIQRTTLFVFEAFIDLLEKHGGKIFPSLVGLSHLATVSKATVVKALEELEFFGFLTRHRRIKRIMTAFGERVVQDTNAYTLHEARGWGEHYYRVIRGRRNAPHGEGGSESNFSPAREPSFSSSLYNQDIKCSKPFFGTPKERLFAELRAEQGIT